jgi:hypothetical protein
MGHHRLSREDGRDKIMKTFLALLSLWGLALMVWLMMQAIENHLSSKLVIIMAVFISIQIVFPAFNSTREEAKQKAESVKRAYDSVSETIYHADQTIDKIQSLPNNLKVKKNSWLHDQLYGPEKSKLKGDR